MLDKFKNLNWPIQLCLMLCLGALLWAGVWYFFTSETRAETAKISDEVAQLQQQNENARLATSHINEFRTLFATKTAEYDELKVLLPEQREITNVLQGLQDTANSSKLIVMRFSPRDDTQQNDIMAKPVEVEVDSNFANLKNFFEQMAKLPRIVSITDFKLNQLDKQTANKTLHAQFLLSAYYAAPTDLNAKPGAKPGAPGAPGAKPAAPGTAAPAAAPAAAPVKPA